MPSVTPVRAHGASGRGLAKGIMPNGLDKALNATELADVIAFLKSLGVNVNPR